MTNYCPNCECAKCTKAKRDQKLWQKAMEACARWNWDAHPIEIATELCQLDEDIEEEKEILDAHLKAIEEWFGKDMRLTIEDSMPYIKELLVR